MNAPHQFPDPSPSREGMADLAARVEAADGPDRELDWLAYDAIGKPKTTLPMGETFGSATITWAPFYTQSLDAAVTLVPEGWTAEIWRYPSGRGNAILSEWSPPCRKAKVIDAATPALALVAAALRARAAQ